MYIQHQTLFLINCLTQSLLYQSPVSISNIDLTAYRAALTWLLNYTAADVPAPSSIAESFWSSNLQLGDPSTYGIVVQNFQSILSFPIWLFNDNNFGNIRLKSNEMISGMPSQFYTMASIVAPYSAYSFDTTMFLLFIVFQGLAMIFVWMVLFWVWFGGNDLPPTSSFPLFDIKYKTQISTENGELTQGRFANGSGFKVDDAMRVMVARTKQPS